MKNENELNLDGQNLKISNSNIFTQVAEGLYFALMLFGMVLGEDSNLWAVVCIVTFVLLPAVIGFLSKNKTVNVKYGDNKATLNINHRNYDVYLSQVNRIEYELVKQESGNRKCNKDYSYAHKFKIHYGSQDFAETLKLQDDFFSSEEFKKFENSQFVYLFKFLTSKHGGRVVSCLDGKPPLFEDFETMQNSDNGFLYTISCSADKYQCHDDKFPVGFVGCMTADFLNDRVVIQVPNNCFIAYYRDILNVCFDGEYFILQYKNTINFKIHIINNGFSQAKAKQIAEQLQDKIKEYY